jgi:hypothetical protein
MKVLLAIDGSPPSEAATAEVAQRQWPKETEILVLTVIHPQVPLLLDLGFVIAAAHAQQLQDLETRAPTLVRVASREIRRARPDVRVRTKVMKGAATS